MTATTNSLKGRLIEFEERIKAIEKRQHELLKVFEEIRKDINNLKEE